MRPRGSALATPTATAAVVPTTTKTVETKNAVPAMTHSEKKMSAPAQPGLYAEMIDVTAKKKWITPVKMPTMRFMRNLGARACV